MLGYLRPSSSTDARNAFQPAALPEPGGHRLYLRRGLARLPFDPAPAATSASDEIHPVERPRRASPAQASADRVSAEAAASQHSCCDIKEALMGQYHHPVCIEAAEGSAPTAWGAGSRKANRALPAPARRTR